MSIIKKHMLGSDERYYGITADDDMWMININGEITSGQTKQPDLVNFYKALHTASKKYHCSFDHSYGCHVFHIEEK